MKDLHVFDNLNQEAPIKVATFYDEDQCHHYLEAANSGWREQYYSETGKDWDLDRERYLIENFY